MIHCSDKGNGMIKQSHLIEYNCVRQIAPYRGVKEGLSKKVTTLLGQEAMATNRKIVDRWRSP